MNKQDAYKLLNIENGDSFKDVRRKYHALMHRHHPDIGSNSDSEMAIRLNAAFELIKREGLLNKSCSYADLGFKENKKAFCKRKMYMDDSLFGDDIIVDTGAYGYFFWEPDLESFDIFIKSINEAASGILGNASVSARAKLFHLLIQQFIDPYECITILYPNGRFNAKKEFECQISCHIKPEYGIFDKSFEKTLSIVPVDSRLFLFAETTKLGQIDFDENYLYYVITPLFIQEAADYRLKISAKKTLRRSASYYPAVLFLTIDSTKKKDMTSRINLEIASLLK
ncbi:MAG: hypothetical protein K5877_09600 [Lachnospiraceae bacterium]|nr:hypothetical protein [Lachnospiraceae bacterium]